MVSQKNGSQDFRRIANSVVSKAKSVITPLINGPKVLLSASDKAKALAKNLNSNLNDEGISLPVFRYKTNLKLRNISATPKIKRPKEP